jgi:hypothetical protein
MPNLGSEEEQQEVKYCSSRLRRRIRQFYDARKWEEMGGKDPCIDE